MKITNFLITLLAAGSFLFMVRPAHALTTDEQAEAFFTRGLAAEQRGDLVAAENCYTLALRVVASHPAALASLAELEKKLPVKATPTASHTYERDRVEALNDGKEPSSSSDGNIPRFTWYPRRASFEWVQYDFSKPQAVEGCSVYWYNDNGGVKLPEFWKVLYLDDAGNWMPVDGQAPTPALNAWNTIRFKSVHTKGLRLAAQLGSSSSGIFEWKIIPSSNQAPPPLPQPEELWLDDLIPVAAQTGWGSLQVNRYLNLEGESSEQVILDGKQCERFLFAHADSSVSYAVPSGYSQFVAVGISPSRNDIEHYSWNYRVLADGIEVFQSQPLADHPDKRLEVSVELPPNTKSLTLVTDGIGNTNNDHAIWANPRLIKSATILETPAPAPVQPNPKTDFKGWLKTVQFKHGHGDGVIWSVDEGVVLHYSQKDLTPTVRRFEIVSIDPETRTVTWKQAGSENSIRINSDFRKFEWKWRDAPFVPQPLAIELRDSKIFGALAATSGGTPLPAASQETEARLAQLAGDFLSARSSSVNKSHAEAADLLQTRYRTAVTTALANARRGPDLKLVAALEQEITLATAPASIPDIDPAETLDAVAQLRSIYRKQSAAADRNRDTELQGLYDRYEAELAALEVSVAANPQDAAAVRATRKSIADQRPPKTGP